MCYDTGVYNLPAQDEGPISPHLLAVLCSALSSVWVLAWYSEYTMLLLSWLMYMDVYTFCVGHLDLNQDFRKALCGTQV